MSDNFNKSEQKDTKFEEWLIRQGYLIIDSHGKLSKDILASNSFGNILYEFSSKGDIHSLKINANDKTPQSIVDEYIQSLQNNESYFNQLHAIANSTRLRIQLYKLLPKRSPKTIGTFVVWKKKPFELMDVFLSPLGCVIDTLMNLLDINIHDEITPRLKKRLRQISNNKKDQSFTIEEKYHGVYCSIFCEENGYAVSMDTDKHIEMIKAWAVEWFNYDPWFFDGKNRIYVAKSYNSF